MRTRTSLALAVALLAIGGLTACGSSESDGETVAAESSSCVYQEGGNQAKDAEVPPAKPINADSLTIKTNRGNIVTTLSPDTAPCTVSSFASLAEQGYFDGTKCHRLVPGFVLQCGDPSATGSGGPGYSYADELKGDETYPAGTLAMANSGPDTNGSQFFIVLDDADLPAAYTVFGSVDEAGLAVARKIADEGNGPDGVAPAKDVIIESVS